MSGRMPAISALAVTLLGLGSCHALLALGGGSSSPDGRRDDARSTEAGRSLERSVAVVDRKVTDGRRTEQGAKKDGGCGPVVPLSLLPVTPVPQPLIDAKNNFNATKTVLEGYLADIRPFELPACLGAPPSLAAITPLTLGDIQGLSFETGQILPRSTLTSSLLFGTQHSLGGPALLQAADQFGGAPVAAAWCGETEIACRNCTDYRVVCVLFYPGSRRVLRIDGGHILDG